MTDPTTKDPLLLDHEYDGIQEYDNPLPRWWVWLFWATIVYSILYFLNVPGIGIGNGRIAAYEADVAEALARAPEETLALPPDSALNALARDPDAVTAGATIFSTRCSACHGPDGGGIIGPNLTDDYWVHGAEPGQIYQTVSSGVLAKGMPAWDRLLAPAEVSQVVAFVLSLRGTTPANPKAPEGTPATIDSGGPPQ